MKRIRVDVSPLERFTTKIFKMRVEKGTTEIHLRLVESSTKAGNELKILIYDPCGDFRGWMDKNKDELLLKKNESSLNGVSGYLPEGEWKILIEFGMISNDFLCEIEEDSSLSPSNSEWFVGELHSHTTKSDGAMSIEELIKEAKNHGLDFIFITDHDVPLLTNKRNKSEGNFKVFPGTELTTFKGHALALGISRHVNPTLLHKNPEDASNFVKSEGGIFGIAHPFFPPSPYCSGCKWSYNVSPKFIDFLEIWNSGGTGALFPAFNFASLSLWTEFLNDGYKIPATSGGDIHLREDFNEFWIPYHVRADEFELKQILCSIRSGKSYASRGNFFFEVLYRNRTYQCGDIVKISDGNSFEIHVKTENASKILLMSSKGAMMVDSSSVNKKIEVDGIRWINAVALYKNSIVGFSNPIYFEHLDYIDHDRKEDRAL